MITVPAAMFEIGGKPRFHALDPGSVGPRFTSLFVSLPVVSFFLYFLIV